MQQVNMSDSSEVMHAALLDLQEEERLEKLPKKIKKKEEISNVMWDNLSYLELKQKKYE